MNNAVTEPETMATASRTSTRTSTVYDRLRDDILDGHLKPGGKLHLKELIEKYNTGNSPLREALNRLSANGMVIRAEHRELQQAVLDRNADQAVEVLARHYTVASEIVLTSGQFD